MNNKKMVWAVVGVVFLLATLGFGVDWYMTTKPSIAEFILSLSAAVLSWFQFFTDKTPVIAEKDENGKPKNNKGKDNGRVKTMPNNKKDHTLPGDLSWFDRQWIKKMKFDACSIENIVKTLEVVEVPASVVGETSTKNENYIDLLADYIRMQGVKPLLRFADRVWYFERRYGDTTIQWRTLAENICKTYDKKSLGELLEDKEIIKCTDFPSDDLLNCR